MIELRALGGLRLRDSADGHEILSVLSRAKPSGLLVYMALSPPTVSHGRDELLELLWPGSSNEKARNSLNQALHVLRGGLGPGVIETTEGGDLILEAGAVWCDVAAFDEALASGHAGEALELYGGHLWDGSDLSDCPSFERWLDGERQRLRLHAVEAAVTLAQELERDGSYVDAAQWLRRARDWAPYDEAVVRPLLKLLHGLGDRAAAVREYDAYEKRLADVELTSSTEIAELIEKIRRSAAGPDPAVFTVIPEAEPTGAASPRDGHGGRFDLNGSTPASSGSDRFWRGVAAGAVGAALAAGAAILSWPPASGPESPDSDPRLVLVRPLSNETGRPDLDRLGSMAADWISKGLGETGVVRVVPTTPIGANGEIDSAIAPTQAGSIRRAGTSVSGSFYSMGDSVSFQVHIIESSSGAVLASVGSVLASIQDPEAGLEELRRRTTGALASAVDPLLASWVWATRPPPSYEAYQLFAQGFADYWEAERTVGPRDTAGFLTAADYFQRAAALDSTYALPLLWEVYARGRGLDREGAASALAGLTRRRDALTRWEQHALDAELADREGDLLRRYAALSRLVAMTPGSEWNFWLADVAGNLGRYEEAITLLEEVRDVGWMAEFDWYWYNLTRSRHFAGQYERELEDTKAFGARFPDRNRGGEIVALAALGRVEEALEYAFEPSDFTVLVSELFTHGHSEAAQRVIRNHLPKVALIDPNRGDADRLPSGLARLNARLLFLTGRLAEAENLLRPLLEEYPRDRFVWTLLVEVVLAKGDREDAVRISDRFAEVGGISPQSKALAQAMMLMHLEDRAGVLELLRPIFSPPQRPQQLLFSLHRNGPVPQSMADYAPFQQLVGWPPPLPN